MKHSYFSLTCAGLLASLSLSTSLMAYGQEQETIFKDIITVNGTIITPLEVDTMIPEIEPLSGPDIVRYIARLPGMNINNNGQISGQVQYRGLFGPRINVKVNGETIASGGPGWMDPPLHYAPMPLISHIEVDRGVSPVRNGPGFAGGVNAVFKFTDFTKKPDFALGYDVNGAYRSADNGTAYGGIIGLSNDQFRFNIMASDENGDNLKFPGGEISATEYHRLVYGVSSGVRVGQHEFGLELRRQETDNSGNPPFPMDIRFFNSDFATLTYKGDFDFGRLEAKFSGGEISHGMTNFLMRPAPASRALYRETLASSFKRDASLMAAFKLAEGELKLGADTEFTKFKSRIGNPNNAGFYLDNVAIVSQDRNGLFAEWTGALASLNVEIGGRVDWYGSKAGQASVGPALPMMPHMLAKAYNKTARVWGDTTFDGVLRLWKNTDGPITWRTTLARKTRVPGHLDRFAWLPTTASAGLADGNIYLGDQAIKSEKAWSGELGFDYRSKQAYFRPTVFYRSIDDYIQGIPFDDTVGVIDTPQEMVARMNGDPTPLKFGNVDAKLYGVDMDFGVKLSGPWRIDGTASYVRGQRRDINDNLYRVSPPNLSLTGTYETKDWSLSLEGKFVAKQNNVSASNSELATDGYTVVGLSGNYQIRKGIMVSAGVENIFDTFYAEHLSGYNRIKNSDVPLGVRLPGAGRGVYIKLMLRN
ncbi:MAG: TonB-dependent receptor [Robiginitomaculum sp.]